VDLLVLARFLKLGGNGPVPGVLARMPTESRTLTTHHHAPSASVKCWVTYCETFFVRGHAADMQDPNRNGIKSCNRGSGRVQ
jgi:hypothetical protein